MSLTHCWRCETDQYQFIWPVGGKVETHIERSGKLHTETPQSNLVRLLTTEPWRFQVLYTSWTPGEEGCCYCAWCTHQIWHNMFQTQGDRRVKGLYSYQVYCILFGEMTRFVLLRHGLCVTLVTLQENPHCITPGKWQYQSPPSSYIGNSPHDDRLARWYRAGLWVGLKTPDSVQTPKLGRLCLFRSSLCVFVCLILIWPRFSLLWCLIQPLSVLVILNHRKCKLYLCLLSLLASLERDQSYLSPV